MRARLFLPYYPYGDFGNDSKEISDKEYAEQLLQTFGGEYNAFMNDAMRALSDPRYNMVDLPPEEYAINSVEDRSDVEYYTFDCLLNNEEDKNLSRAEFDFLTSNGDMVAIFVHLNVGEDNSPDAVDELNLWLKESKDIMENPHINDDARMGMLPYKDLKAEIDGEMFLFETTGVVDQDNRNNFAIIVNKIKKI